jgi:fumarate reductase (CoM/CoB) subunit B
MGRVGLVKDSLRAYFEDVDETCIRCGICEKSHKEAQFVPFMFGDLAERLLVIDKASASDIDVLLSDELLYLIRGCALCGECTAACPVGISASECMMNARIFLDMLRPEIRHDYQDLRTDESGNLFERIRAIRGIAFEDYLDAPVSSEAPKNATLFFPGCSLVAYAPEITELVAGYLEECADSVGVTVSCCGNPIRDMGLSEEFVNYAHYLNERLHSHQVTRLIIACPNCFDAFTSMKDEKLIDTTIELVPLPEFLVAQGAKIDPSVCAQAGFCSASVHDSCPDRFSLRFGNSLRTLLGGVVELREMEHAKEHTICCGAGGLVSSFDVQRCMLRADRRLDEFAATGADCLVTGCVSCSSALRRSDDSLPVRHYLELLFDTPIDWEMRDRARYGEGEQEHQS